MTLPEDLPIDSPTVDEWIGRFKEAGSPRGKLDKDFLALEDLVVFGICSLFPPQVRGQLVGKMLPMLGEMAEHTGELDDEDHKHVHEMIVRAVGRISASLEEAPRPHPFEEKIEDEGST